MADISLEHRAWMHNVLVTIIFQLVVFRSLECDAAQMPPCLAGLRPDLLLEAPILLD